MKIISIKFICCIITDVEIHFHFKMMFLLIVYFSFKKKIYINKTISTRIFIQVWGTTQVVKNNWMICNKAFVVTNEQFVTKDYKNNISIVIVICNCFNIQTELCNRKSFNYVCFFIRTLSLCHRSFHQGSFFLECVFIPL